MNNIVHLSIGMEVERKKLMQGLEVKLIKSNSIGHIKNRLQRAEELLGQIDELVTHLKSPEI